MNDLDRIFGRLNEMAVGFGPVFREARLNNISYPPHNIITISDDEFLLELAVAGFKKSEITIQEAAGVLSIKGEKADESDKTDTAYQHRGIARRSFTKSLRIAEYFEITSATLEDGILTIRFVKNIPEEAKPKLIAID